MVYLQNCDLWSVFDKYKIFEFFQKKKKKKNRNKIIVQKNPMNQNILFFTFCISLPNFRALGSIIIFFPKLNRSPLKSHLELGFTPAFSNFSHSYLSIQPSTTESHSTGHILFHLPWTANKIPLRYLLGHPLRDPLSPPDSTPILKKPYHFRILFLAPVLLPPDKMDI